MGATDFFTTASGKNIKEAYSKAVEYAIDEYGNDSYNGTISTTISVKDVTAEYHKSKMELEEFMNEYLNKKGTKRDCYAICLNPPIENNNKTKTVVKNKPYKGTRKWETVYDVTDYSGEIFTTKLLKEEAIVEARKRTEKTGDKTYIRLRKRLVGSDYCVAEIEYKKSDKERPGRWKFFGYAAC
jgi:hypothetical protein